jgi:hypothetical protein
MTSRKVQGEGDRESARNFNEQSQAFVKSEKGRRTVKKSDHSGEFSPDELQDAERDAAQRARENDPEVLRDYSRPAKK